MNWITFCRTASFSVRLERTVGRTKCLINFFFQSLGLKKRERRFTVWRQLFTYTAKRVRNVDLLGGRGGNTIRLKSIRKSAKFSTSLQRIFNFFFFQFTNKRVFSWNGTIRPHPPNYSRPSKSKPIYLYVLFTQIISFCCWDLYLDTFFCISIHFVVTYPNPSCLNLERHCT